MNFNEYQTDAITTAIYSTDYEIIYPTLGLCGETGEVAEKIKKILRDKNGVFSDEDKKAIAKELGDILWYIANLANDLELTLEDIAKWNLDKLFSRKERNTLKGSGDER